MGKRGQGLLCLCGTMHQVLSQLQHSTAQRSRQRTAKLRFDGWGGWQGWAGWQESGRKTRAYVLVVHQEVQCMSWPQRRRRRQ